MALGALTTTGMQMPFGDLPILGRLVLSVLMLLGRLEIYPILIGLTGLFLRNESDL